MKCQLKVEIGEEILRTKVQEDKPNQIPSWKDDVLVFQLLKGVTKEGKVKVMDGEE